MSIANLHRHHTTNRIIKQCTSLKLKLNIPDIKNLCCICLRVLNTKKPPPHSIDKIQNEYETCRKHLNKNVTEYCIEWNSLQKLRKTFPFCTKCLHFSILLNRLNWKAKKILTKMKKLSERFSIKTLRKRKKSPIFMAPVRNIASTTEGRATLELGKELDLISANPINNYQRNRAMTDRNSITITDEGGNEIKVEIEEFPVEIPDNAILIGPTDSEDDNLALSSASLNQRTQNTTHCGAQPDPDDDDGYSLNEHAEGFDDYCDTDSDYSNNEDDNRNADVTTESGTRTTRISNKAISADDDKNERPLTCKMCGKGFANIGEIREHFKSHASDARKRGPPKIVDSTRPKRKYSKRENNDNPDKESNNENLNEVSPDTEYRPFKCKECGNLFRTKQSRRVHYRSFHAGQKKSITKSTADGVINMEEADPISDDDEKGFWCDTCNRGYQSKYQLGLHCATASHIRKSTNTVDPADADKPFKCSVCRKGFSTISRRNYHSFREHKNKGEQIYRHDKPEDSKPFKCKLCNKTFHTAYTRRDHCRTQHPDVTDGREKHADDDYTPFSCKVCNKRFTSGKHRNFHYFSMHQEKEKLSQKTDGDNTDKDLKEDQRPFKCEICDKSFESINQFKRHCDTTNHLKKKNLQLSNTVDPVERPFKCKVCKKCYCEKYFLKRHMTRRHTAMEIENATEEFVDKKPFKCKLCGKCFSATTSRKYHYLHSHKGEEVDSVPTPPNVAT